MSERPYVSAQTELASFAGRFREKVYINGDGCWLWRARINAWGYGTYHEDRMMLAHRYAWEVKNGLVPNGMILDHTCFNRDCARPAHLRLVTHKQNNEHRVGANANNRSTGVRGVRYSYNRYRVRVRHHDVLHDGGSFLTLAEADSAAQALRAKLFSHDDGRHLA